MIQNALDGISVIALAVVAMVIGFLSIIAIVLLLGLAYLSYWFAEGLLTLESKSPVLPKAVK
jgi:nucleoside permease NupC